MRADVATARSGSTVQEARALADEHGLALVFVVDDAGQLVGFVTRKALSAAPSGELAVGKLASMPTVTVAPWDPLEKAVVLLKERYLLLPVVEDGRLAGILTRGGLLRALAHMCGFGETGTRIRIRPGGSGDVFRALERLGRRRLELVAAIQGEPGEFILHVRGVEDKEALSRELRETLGWAVPHRD